MPRVVPLQHTATHCSTHHTLNTLQHTSQTATHCNTPLSVMLRQVQLQHTATHYNTLQHTPTHSNTPLSVMPRVVPLQHTTTHCNTLQHTSHISNTPTHSNTPLSVMPRVVPLQHTATHCNNTSQHTSHNAPHCNTPQHTFVGDAKRSQRSVAVCCSVLQCVAVCCSALCAPLSVMPSVVNAARASLAHFAKVSLLQKRSSKTTIETTFERFYQNLIYKRQRSASCKSLWHISHKCLLHKEQSKISLTLTFEKFHHNHRELWLSTHRKPRRQISRCTSWHRTWLSRCDFFYRKQVQNTLFEKHLGWNSIQQI